MADIFISYAKADRNLAQQLAAHLEAQGRTTWWDATIGANDNFRGAVERELECARKAIVLWSDVSIASPFVLHEAITARDAAKLVQVKTSNIQVSDIPRPFRALPLLDASDLAGIGRAVSDHVEKAKELPVQAMAPNPMPLGRPDESHLTPAAAGAIGPHSPDLMVPSTQVLGTPPARSPRPGGLHDEVARQSNRLGNALFALAAVLVAVVDVAIFWHYGVFDGLSGLATKLLALVTWNVIPPLGSLPHTHEKAEVVDRAEL